MLKRSIDLIGSLAGLLFLWPVILAALLAVRLETPGAPLFRQVRLGRNQKPFVLYKIRSMHTDVKTGPTHTMPPSATTRVGNVLRRTKIDELPQLMNVLLGHMSLVGPRPCLPMQTELIASRARRGVFRVRPGVTGLAQVHNIDMSDPEQLAAVDEDYVARAAPALDVQILLATVLRSRAPALDRAAYRTPSAR